MSDSSRSHVHLTRRERQIMDVLYTAEEASAAGVHKVLPNSPSYSAVLSLLGADGDKLAVEDLAAIEREIARLKQGSG